MKSSPGPDNSVPNPPSRCMTFRSRPVSWSSHSTASAHCDAQIVSSPSVSSRRRFAADLPFRAGGIPCRERRPSAIEYQGRRAQPSQPGRGSHWRVREGACDNRPKRSRACGNAVAGACAWFQLLYTEATASITLGRYAGATDATRAMTRSRLAAAWAAIWSITSGPSDAQTKSRYTQRSRSASRGGAIANDLAPRCPPTAAVPHNVARA